MGTSSTGFAEITHAGQPAVEISTPGATWTYQTEAGGFSSLRDRDGVEWIGFAPGTPGRFGPANVFRGIPNLVYPDNIGHPGYTHVETVWSLADDAVRLTSAGHGWRWQWTIRPAGARLEILASPAKRRYWFLYEGVPGGRYDPDRARWGCDTHPIAETAPRLDDPFTGSCRWIWFGHQESPRVLLLRHETSAGEPSMVGWMKAVRTEDNGPDEQAIGGEGMVVFGFGRSHADGPLSHLSGAHEFTVRFVESTNKNEIES
jgi:hypothetical protein